jgi:hypothetical protein
MAQRPSKWVPVSAALSVAVLAPLVACSSAPTESHGGASAGTPPASHASVASSAPVAEADRVHEYLEGRYPASGVRHSFRTALGQTADCVDFFQMPGVRAMAARGQPITEMPKPPAPRPRRLRDGSTVIDPPQPAPVSEGVDEDGHDRLCPEGTVLQLRITPDDIAREGGLDAYRVARQKHPAARVPQASPAAPPSAQQALPAMSSSAPPATPPTMWPCESGEFHDYAHVIGDIVDTTPGVEFGMDTMAVYNPAIPQEAGNHNVGQVWMFGGTIAQDLPTDPGCNPATQACVQSIEIGWMVSQGDSNAHVFTYSTLDGYTLGPNGADLDGCWNGEGGSNCPPFIWSSGYTAAVTPGAIIPVNGPFATPPQELSALVIDIGGNYWVQVGVAGARYYIGYYPGSNFAGPLSTFQVGGEVFGSQNDFTNPAIPMGSGFPSAWGYGWAAYHHDFSATVYWNGQQTDYWTAASMCASTPPNYSYAPYGYSTAPAPGASSWSVDGGYFYYGNTPAPCTPTTCAAAGDNCGAIANGCGSTLECGACGAGNTCVGNVCRCAAERCPILSYWDYYTCSCVRRIRLDEESSQ